MALFVVIPFSPENEAIIIDEPNKASAVKWARNNMPDSSWDIYVAKTATPTPSTSASKPEDHYATALKLVKDNPGLHAIRLIKELRDQTHLGLNDAKQLIAQALDKEGIAHSLAV